MATAEELEVRVLIVENDPLFTHLVTSILGALGDGFEIVAVSRLSSALAQLVRDGVGLAFALLEQARRDQSRMSTEASPGA